ncbi:MAG TPA: KH domain-containing protein [Candidatus Paceibacterota bacterium]
MIDQDQQVLDYIIRQLVDHPESIKINRTIDEKGVLLSLDVHAEDMGKVIGKMGHTAQAIRTILRVVGIKNGARVNLKINEPEGSTRGEVASSRPVLSTTPTMKTVDEAMADLNL